MISYKNHTVFARSVTVPWHPELISLLIWVDITKKISMITSAFRPADNGVHGQVPLRGLDIRSRDYESPEWLVDYINEYWTYDPMRPKFKCAILHDIMGEHIHLQVCDNTQMKGGP